MALSPNIPVAVTAACVLAMLFYLRCCDLSTWLLLVAVPAVAYGLLAETTKQTPIKDAVVLVTGASSGLGKAIAKDAARRGAKTVILVSRTRSKLEEVARELVELNGKVNAVVITCDLYSIDAMKALAEKVVQEHGPLDLLVNNAGAGAWKHTEDTSPEEAVEMMACPYQAAFSLSSLFTPSMVAANTGHILNITSAASMLGIRGAVGYATTRWAVRGFSRCLAQDMKELGVGVTLLNAGEITGTEYFSNAAGKAGGDSYQKIPYLFQLVDKLGLNMSTDQVAAAALMAVEKGWMETLVPSYLLYPTMVLYSVVPAFVELVCNVGQTGMRKKSN